MKMPFRFVKQYKRSLIDQFDEASHGQQNDGVPRTQFLEEASRARLENHFALIVKQRRDIWAAAYFLDTDLSSLSLLELYGADVPDGRMPSGWVVKAFDVVEHVSPYLVSASVDLACHPLGLQ